MRLHSLLFFRFYLDDCQALVFMVDSSEPARLPEAQKVLKKILNYEKLKNVPVMVLANKKDLPDSMTIREVPTQTHSVYINESTDIFVRNQNKKKALVKIKLSKYRF